MRPSKRANNELRSINITRNYTKHAEGSALIEFGATKVICTASVINGVPKFLKESGQGWLTAEYGMLPRATHLRTDREATRGKQGGRTQEIQRIIGRALRAIVNLKAIKEHTIILDCDVIQADGGTRTAAITGSCVAVIDALRYLQHHLKTTEQLYSQLVAAVSVGIYQGNALLDLDYAEDCHVDTDMNVVMTEDGNFVEIQGTAEHQTFSHHELTTLLEFAQSGIIALIEKQKEVLGLNS